MNRLSGAYWNASFGAVLDYADLVSNGSPVEAARAFIAEGIELLQPAE
jgi:hypothetical protein